MKKRIVNICKVLCAVVLSASLVSVGSPVDTSGENEFSVADEPVTNSFAGVTLTVSFRNLTEFGVAFYGKAILSNNLTADSFGIALSTKREFSESTASYLSVDDIYGTSYSISIDSLEPATTYYYAPYIKKGSFRKFGAVRSFTTPRLSAPVLYSVSQITEATAKISGRIVPLRDKSSNVEYGLECSQRQGFEWGVKRQEITDIYSDNKFSASISSLVPGTQYYYRSYIRVRGVYAYGEARSLKTLGLTAPVLDVASEITEFGFKISGQIVPILDKSTNVEYGLECSQSEDFASGVKRQEITDIYSDNKFSASISSLVPGTQYYYRSYIKMSGVYAYGEARSLKTLGLTAPVLDEASEITESGFKMSGQIVPILDKSTNVEYGLECSQSKDFKLGVKRQEISDIYSDNKFSASISSLAPRKQYYYRSYIRVNGSCAYGYVKSFTTKEINLNLFTATNLSDSGSANCYIVSKAGLYKFKTVKGNSSESVGNVSSALILWETFGTFSAPAPADLIKAVDYENGYIAFQTVDTFKEGNAVIAAKDANGNILWSWHIWLTDQPQCQVYYNNAGTMMDRNLGATSATPGDVGALGLLYQWGRKDPFLGSSSISDDNEAKSTITWPSAVSSNSSRGTVSYVTAHPTTFVYSYLHPYDWHYSSRDNSLWTTSDKTKSIYDPCPAGWRVPDGGSKGVWSKALSSSYKMPSYDSANEGMNFSGKFGSASPIWYPASGYRSYSDGSLINVGYNGIYWSASPNNGSAYDLYFSGSGYVFPSDYNYRAYGRSVRCLQVIDKVAEF